MRMCNVDGCTKKVGQGGMCYMHYHRMRYHGTTDLVRQTWQERFWSKVDKSGSCWLWTAARDRAGYGLFGSTQAPGRAAHRLAYLLANEDPGERHVLHRCDNPPCVNPAHLFLGDDAANHADMASKLRSTWGEKNARAKLTVDQVRAIRSQLDEGVPHRVIAEAFGISRPTVSDILHRRSWYHLP